MHSSNIAARARRLTDTQVPTSTKTNISAVATEHHHAHGGLISSSNTTSSSPGEGHWALLQLLAWCSRCCCCLFSTAGRKRLAETERAKNKFKRPVELMF